MTSVGLSWQSVSVDGARYLDVADRGGPPRCSPRYRLSPVDPNADLTGRSPERAGVRRGRSAVVPDRERAPPGLGRPTPPRPRRGGTASASERAGSGLGVVLGLVRDD